MTHARGAALRTLLLPLLLAPLASFSSCSGEDGGGDMNTVPAGVCPGNANVGPDAAIDLAAGKSAQGYLCPLGNQHWFKITVPAGSPLVTINLGNDTTLSPVTLTYTLRDSDGMKPIDQPPTPKPAMAKQRLSYTHCVPKPGTYYIQVQSNGNDAQDPRNPFTLSYAPAADPNPMGGANSSLAGALDLAAGSATGFIACKGERRYYKLNVPAGNLLQVGLTTVKPTPSLNLMYRVLDAQQTLVASDAVPSGAAAPTSLQSVRTLPGGGTYYVVVADQADAGADIASSYTLKVSSLAEPDTSERPARNDVPASATSLGSFACGGATQSFSKTAFLASRADIDWYQVNVSGTGAACAATLDVNAAWASTNNNLQPQVLLAYPDASTSCVKDEDCRVLSKTCTDDNSCQYLGNQCAKPMNRCTGAALCLPSKVCGVIQYAKNFTRPTMPVAPFAAAVRTAQPLVPGIATYYVGVRDFTAQGYDQTAPYTLNVRLDTDDKEPNNFYSPYVQADNALVRSPDFYTRNKISLGAAVTGRIGYERDQDFFVFDHPCPGMDCTLEVSYSSNKATPVYFTYQIEVDGKLWAGWPAPPATRLDQAPQVPDTLFGDGTNTCLFAAKNQTGPFLLWVSDLVKGGPKWDQSASYTFTVRKKMDGCSDLCKTKFACGT